MLLQIVTSIIFLSATLVVTPAQAQTLPAEPTPTLEVASAPAEIEIASEAADVSSSSGTLASPSAEVVEKIRQRADEDITDTGGEKKSELARYLDENPIQPITWHNFLQHAIRNAIEKGLPANTVVLILLFPVITTIIAFSKHIIGLKGFGIYIPAALSVAFVSTGILSGVVMFMTIFLAAMGMRVIVKRSKMSYLPRTAILLWGVSLTVLSFLITGSYLNIIEFLTLNIFPILIMILLMENFMESQLFNKQATALRLTLETLFISVICSLVIDSGMIHRFVLLNPELVSLIVLIINFAIGQYTGLRLLEYFRFKSILERE